MKQFRFRLITPERCVADSKVECATLTAVDGQIGILADHAPLMCELAPGVVVLRRADHLDYYFVAGGFAEFLDNELVVITSEAVHASDIQTDKVQKELEDLKNKVPKTEEERAFIAQRRKIADMKLQIARISQKKAI